MQLKLTLDEDLIAKAQNLTGLKDVAALVHEGLKTLIGRESARRLILLGGTEPEIAATFRRRSREE